jgi:hypothetical protein
MAIMTSRQAAELDFAFERNGWTAKDVKALSEGNTLSKLHGIVLGIKEARKNIKELIENPSDCPPDNFIEAANIAKYVIDDNLAKELLGRGMDCLRQDIEIFKCDFVKKPYVGLKTFESFAKEAAQYKMEAELQELLETALKVFKECLNEKYDEEIRKYAGRIKKLLEVSKFRKKSQ